MRGISRGGRAWCLRAEMWSQGGGPAQGESGDARPLAREGRERVMW